MPDTPYDVVVLGAGPAGVTAALRARELGATVAVVERGPLGGACTNDGCVPTRFLAHAARLVRNAAEYADYGLDGTAPTPDFTRILSRAQAMVGRIHEKKGIRAHLERVGAALYDSTGAARFVDPYTISCDSGLTIRGAAFILCVGGHARRLALPGGELALTHSDVWTMDRMPARLLIVGAAATGCQLASVFAAFGSKVTLSDAATSPVPTEDPDVSTALASAFVSRGIELRLCGGVGAIEAGTDSARRVQLLDGSKSEWRDYDAVIAAVGWTGNVDDLALDVAGVEAARGYVTVDAGLRTSASHIFAAGDVTGRMMLVQSAGEEGRAAADAALGRLGPARFHTIVPHGGFTDPEYGSVGLTEPQAAGSLELVTASIPYQDLDRAIIDGRPDGFCKLIVDRETRKIAGAHVVGQQAVEIVQVAATAMQADATIDQVAHLEYAYPTFTSVIGLAARRIVQQLDGSSARDEARSDTAEWEASNPR